VRFLTQVKIISRDDFEYYLKDFPEEPKDFQGFVNLELGILFDDHHTVISVDFVSETTVVVVYKMKI
jgi:hypothetical protein